MVTTDIRTVFAVLALTLASISTAAQDRTTTTSVPDLVGPYTVTASAETGVRGVKVEGDEAKYRSDLNYQPGFQFIDSSLLLEAPPNEAPLFDTLLVKVTGWDSDPSGYLRVDADKLDWYRFSATVRRFAYFNELDNLALGQHRDDTTHRLGDFSLTLLPQHKPFRLNLGYSYDRLGGDSTTTYDYSRDEFPLFAPLRSSSDTLSVGFDANVGRFDVSFLQGFRRFKDDPTSFVTGAEVGNDGAGVPTLLTSLDRFVPTRGHVDFTRATVHSMLGNRVDVTGRVAFSHATTDSSLSELLTGVDYLGHRIDLGQSASTARTERPDVLADLGVTVLATEALTISNTFHYNWFKIDGSDGLTELLRLDGGPITSTGYAYSRLTKYRVFSDTIELDYEFDPRVSAHVGYRYSDRSIDLTKLDAVNGEAEDPELEPFDNRANTFLFGLRAKPIKRYWTLYFDFEKGENDNFFTRIANYDYTSVRVRNRVQVKDSLAINVSAWSKDNDNPARTEDIPPVDFGAHTKSRVVAATVDWTPSTRLMLSSGYTFSKVDTDAVVVFFLNYQKQQGLSQYFSRNNFAYASATAQIAPRVSLYGAYRFVDDTGAGDRVAPAPTVLISSYPYRSQSPEARCSVRLNDSMDLNVGYQYFKFEERYRSFNPNDTRDLQDYTAHLPYVSVRWYLGRR